jgi:hypothetical protein
VAKDASRSVELIPPVRFRFAEQDDPAVLDRVAELLLRLLLDEDAK